MSLSPQVIAHNSSTQCAKYDQWRQEVQECKGEVGTRDRGEASRTSYGSFTSNATTAGPTNVAVQEVWNAHQAYTGRAGFLGSDPKDRRVPRSRSQSAVRASGRSGVECSSPGQLSHLAQHSSLHEARYLIHVLQVCLQITDHHSSLRTCCDRCNARYARHAPGQDTCYSLHGLLYIFCHLSPCAQMSLSR